MEKSHSRVHWKPGARILADVPVLQMVQTLWDAPGFNWD